MEQPPRNLLEVNLWITSCVEGDVEACPLLPSVVLSEIGATPAHHVAVPRSPHTNPRGEHRTDPSRIELLVGFGQSGMAANGCSARRAVDV
jgi:hypothetical protein